MTRLTAIFILACSAFIVAHAQSPAPVVVDADTREVLRNASVFNSKGIHIGISHNNGRLPAIRQADYPITIRYMGYKEQSIASASCDTIFMEERPTRLSEVTVSAKNQKCLHLLAYVREYSTLSTYTDTVSMFREKTVDFMLPSDPKSRFKGWRRPRILYSKSYYRFTDENGLDSVSDRCNNHFSWGDWVGIPPQKRLPHIIAAGHGQQLTDTIFGKYSPAETWTRKDDRLNVAVNVLADTSERRWVPELKSFFNKDQDFERLRLQLNYDYSVGEAVGPIDLTGYSLNIESNGRGRSMFMFNKVDQPIYVTTYAEVYVIDKNYITLREAKKWEKKAVDGEDIGIIEPSDAPPLQESVLALIDRVNNVDSDGIRLATTPDQRLVGRKIHRNFAQNALLRLANMFGIADVIGRHKQQKKWKDFKRSRTKDFHIERYTP